MNRKISISSTYPQDNHGHVVLVLSLVMLASVGSYSMYNRGVKESGAQIVSRSLQQISIGDVFAQKVLNRVINILKDTPDGTCYNGESVPSQLKSFSIDAMQGFGKMESDHKTDKYRLVMTFDADSSSDGDPPDPGGVTDVKLGHINIIFKNDKDLAECLASEEERLDIDNFYVKITPLHIYKKSRMKQVHVEVGGKVKMEQGDRHKSTGFAKNYVLNLQLIKLKDLGFVFNNPNETPLIEIDSEGEVEVDFKTPVFLYTKDNHITKLSHVISSSGDDGKAWVNPNVVFSRNFYTNAETFDTSESKSVGNVMASFTKGIQVKTFKSIIDKFPDAFEAYLPPASEGKFSNLVYAKVPDAVGDELSKGPPLDKSDPGNLGECSTSKADYIREKLGGTDALDFSENQDITVKCEGGQEICSSSCFREFPLVVATEKEVTIDFSEIDSDHQSKDAVFCGLIMADKINVIGLDDEKFNYTMFGTFITKNIFIKGKDNTNVIFQNMVSIPANLSNLDFVGRINSNSNSNDKINYYKYYFERYMHEDKIQDDKDDNGFKCLNSISIGGGCNSLDLDPSDSCPERDLDDDEAKPKSFFLVR